MTVPVAKSAVLRASGPGRHVYDVAIIGGQLSGVFSAGLLAKRGLRVLYVEHDDAGMGYVHDDWRLPIAPFVLPPLKALPSLDHLLGEIGVATTIQRAVRPAVPPLQLIRPKERIDLWSEPSARAAEIGRALGPGASPLLTALEAVSASADAGDRFFAGDPGLPPEGLLARWRLRRHIARFPALATNTPLTEDEPHQRLLRRLAGFVCPVENPAPVSWARCLGKVLLGAQVYPGGRSALREVLAERARELGVDVLGTADRVSGVAVEGGRAVGVRLERGDTLYRAGAILSACDLATLLRLLPEKNAKSMAVQAKLLAPQRALFTLNVVVPERALPRGLGDLALLEAADFELGTLLIQVGAARRASAEVDSADERTVCVSAVVNLAQHQGGRPAVEALSARIWNELDPLMPFTRQQAIVESAPWLDVASIADGTWEPAPLFPTSADRLLGICGVPTRASLKGLFMASRQVLPGLGIEGEALAASRATTQIEQALHKRDPLKGGSTE